MRGLCLLALLALPASAATPKADAGAPKPAATKAAATKADAGTKAVADAGTKAVADAGTKAVADAGTKLAPDAGPKPVDAGVKAAADPVRDAGATVVKLGPVVAPDKKTERLWKSKCSACHGVDGKAATEKGKKMQMTDFTVAGWQTSKTDAELRKAIVDGRKITKNGVNQEMDAFGSELDADQLTALVGYVRWVGAPH